MESLSPQKTERKNVYDILKALGIISIVIGHCHPNQQVVDFVYAYHLALFLFVSGLQYTINKYSTNPFYFLQSRIKSMWIPTFFYLTFFTITHDLAIQLHLLPSSDLYGKVTILSRALNNFMFLGGETLGGALWFVPVMLVTMLLFAAIIKISYTYFYKIRLIPIICLSCLIGVLGAYYNMKSISLSLHIHTGLLLLPVLTVGYLFVHLKLDFNKIFRWFVALPCLFVVLWIVIKNGHRIELSKELIGDSSVYFYIVTFCGLYLICYLSKVIDRIKLLSHIFVFIGKYTFDIMALHFFVLKIIDGIYGRWQGDSAEVFSTFPCSYRNLWPIYLIASITIPPLVRIGINKLLLLIKSCSQRTFGTPPASM